MIMRKLTNSLFIIGFVGVAIGAILKIEGKGTFANSIILLSIIIAATGILLVFKQNDSVN